MIFYKKIFRDLYKNKSRSFSIIILIFLSFTIAGIYVQPGAVLDATYSQMKIDTNKSDVILDMFPFTSDIFNESILNNWIDTYKVKDVQPRLLFKADIEIDNSIKIKSHIIGLPDNYRPIVNDIITPNNDYFTYNQQEAFIEKSYVETYDISQNSQLNVSVNENNLKANFSIIFKNKANSIEYPFIETAGGGYERSTLAQQLFVMSVFVKISYLQQMLFSGNEVYNQICITFTNPSNKINFINNLRKDNSTFSLYIKDILNPTDILEETTNIMYLVGWMIGLLIFIISLFLIYTTLSRFIEEQKPQIGTLKALGYSNLFIVWHYTLYGLIMSLIGSTLGLLCGIVIGSLIVDPFIGISFSLPYIVYTIPIFHYLLAFTIITICATLVCLLESLSSVKITPQTAVRPEILYLSQKESLFEKMFKLFKKDYRLSPNAKYFIRQIFARPKRTSAIAISVIGAIIIASVSLTLVGGIVNTSNDLVDSIHYDGQIYFNEDINKTEADNLATSNYITSYEPFYVTQARLIQEDNSWINIGYVKGFPENSQLHEFSQNGKLFKSNHSAIVTIDIARILNIQEDKQYLLEGNNFTTEFVTIQEIKTSYIESSFMVPLDLSLKLSTGNTTTNLLSGMLVKVSNDFNKNEFESLPITGSIIMKNDFKDLLLKNYESITLISYVLVIVAFFFGLMIIFGIMNINITERKPDLHIMKSLGISNRNIYLSSTFEAMFYGLLGSLGYVLGFFISVTYQEILAEAMTMPLAKLTFSFENLFFLVIFAIIMTYLSQFLALRLVLKQKIADVTKEKLFG